MLQARREERAVIDNRLTVRLEGPGVEDGVPLDSFLKTLGGVQHAVRLAVEHLGGRKPGRGRQPRWVKTQSALRLVAVRPGSIVAELELATDDRLAESGGYGPQAIETLLNLNGNAGKNLPEAVMDRLCDTASALPEDIKLLLGDGGDLRRVEVKRRSRATTASPGPPRTEKAKLQGWLREVNWHSKSAQLHRYRDRHVRLRFDDSLADDMLRLATQYVEVQGRGRIDKHERWGTVQVDEISVTHSWRESFDMGAFLKNPNPKIFDPERIITASEPFDVDEFVRVIHEGRETLPEDYS